MRKLSIILAAIFCSFIGYSFAEPSILLPSYTVNWDNIKIYRTDNSKGWDVTIAIQNPNTNEWIHAGDAKMSDEIFEYKKTWDWDWRIWMTPGDGWDEQCLCITSAGAPCNATCGAKTTGTAKAGNTTKIDNPTEWTVNRTVIPVVPKTGPTGSIIWIIIAALAIFGGYIYIRKRADI